MVRAISGGGRHPKVRGMIFGVVGCVVPSLMLLSVTDSALAAGDTTVTVKRGDDPDFTIVSDTTELSGEPAMADADARDSWHKACDKWRAEMRELNKGQQIIALDCGAPRPVSGVNANTIYRSQASYKVRVRIRNEK